MRGLSHEKDLRSRQGTIELVEMLQGLTVAQRIEVGHIYASACSVVVCPWCGRETSIRNPAGQLLQLKRKDFDLCVCAKSANKDSERDMMYRSYLLIVEAERRFASYMRADPVCAEMLRCERTARTLEKHAQTLREKARSIKNKTGKVAGLETSPPRPIDPRDREVNAND